MRTSSTYMRKGDYLSEILKSPKSVFTLKEVALLWRESNYLAIKRRLQYYIKRGNLIRIRRGLYAKDQNYNRWELGTKILVPAYISFETVLSREGVIFQYQDVISVASYVTRVINIGTDKYQFNRLKMEVLTNNLGLSLDNHTTAATKERAILDTLAVNQNYYFDNLNGVDWQKIEQLLPIYTNQRVTKLVHKLKQEQV